MEKAVTEQELKERAVAPRVTLEHIEELKKRIQYVMVQQPGDTTSTFVHAYLDGKFFLATGFSACVDPANFKADIGERIARDQAEKQATGKLWELEGYSLYRALEPKQGNFYSRLVDEHAELNDRYQKLTAFLSKGNTVGIHEDDWNDLVDQSRLQADLLAVLAKRITKLKPKQ